MNEVLRVCVLQDDEGSGHIHVYAVDRFKALTEVTDQYNIVAVHYEDEGAMGFAVLRKKTQEQET